MPGMKSYTHLHQTILEGIYLFLKLQLQTKFQFKKGLHFACSPGYNAVSSEIKYINVDKNVVLTVNESRITESLDTSSENSDKDINNEEESFCSCCSC